VAEAGHHGPAAPVPPVPVGPRAADEGPARRQDGGHGEGPADAGERPPGPEAVPHTGVEEGSGRHRARPVAPRGPAARRGAADVYLAAQREGGDPVLAVMAATGLSRRRSLKLIAAARAEGHLPARRHRR
jgi:Family of unknown function (DUF6214)